MASVKNVKILLVGFFALPVLIWLGAGTFSGSIMMTRADAASDTPAVSATPNPDQYVGSQTCQACHDSQFKSVSDTKHGKLEMLPAWKDKVAGCESCHGPGKAHVDGGGDISKIISFKNKNPKQVAETCLACHAGKEQHNNFRRGDHWRNNVGCTDCHTAHGPETGKVTVGSHTIVNKPSDINPTTAMLKTSEQQLCIACHSEVKAHFNKPFRHKVMEGAMNCSDCHNAHGGFETKQTKTAVGTESACIKCHTDKQGPFVFEHAPMAIEGCAACHTPHGSANPRMLKRPQVRQLCLECHSGITDQLAATPSHGPHTQTSIRSQQCTVCHTAIHGSNAQFAFLR